jgi:hypothetical protein
LLRDDENEAFRAAQIENEAFHAMQMQVFALFSMLFALNASLRFAIILETIKFVA